MANILDKLPKMIGKSAGKLLGKPATLIKVTQGARDPAALAAGRSTTERSFPCKGIVEVFRTDQVDGTSIVATDRKVMLFAYTIERGTVVPEKNDKVTIEGVTYGVEDIIGRDPAAATYVLHARPL